MNGKGERLFENLTEIENEVILENYSSADARALTHRQWRILVMSVLCTLLLGLIVYMAVRDGCRDASYNGKLSGAVTIEDWDPDSDRGRVTGMTILHYMSFSSREELAQSSDLILTGRLVSMSYSKMVLKYGREGFFNDPEKKLLGDLYEVEVERVFKGGPLPEKTIRLFVIRGEETEDGVGMNDDHVSIATGKRYLMFLSKPGWSADIYTMLTPTDSFHSLFNDDAIANRHYGDGDLTIDWLAGLENAE